MLKPVSERLEGKLPVGSREARSVMVGKRNEFSKGIINVVSYTSECVWFTRSVLVVPREVQRR